jgi:hypothetical protein
MPNIPLYQESAGRATSTPVSPISAEPQAAIGRALSGVGGQLYQAGSEYLAKKKKLKQDADISDYEVELRKFGTDLEQKKNDALMSGSATYADVYDKVVVPEMAGFQERLGQRGYSKESIDNIMGRWEYDSAGIRDSEIMEREKMELNDYSNRVKTHAFEQIASGDIDAGNSMLDELSGVVRPETISQWKAEGVNILKRKEKELIRREIFVDPLSAKEKINEQLSGGERYYNLSNEELTSMNNAATASYNNQVSANETAMWDRINALKAGDDVDDSFESIQDSLENLRKDNALTPSAYNSLKKVADNPYGETKKPMNAIELGSIWDEIGEYDPEIDTKFDTAQKLWAKINAVPNEQDRTLLKSLMKDAQDGVPQSPYWSEMQELINADSKRNIFGESEISPETGIFAKREVSKYLRNNPTDRKGAEELYKAISADDKKLNTRKFYREKYGYGSSVAPVKKNVRVWGSK